MKPVAMLEATTYLTLLATVVWRVAFDGPDVSSVIGPVHGIAFVAYFVVTVMVRDELEWSARRTVAILVAAVIPAGGYIVAERLATANEVHR